MTVPIAVIGAVSVYTGGATEYPGHLIFAAAAYTFYSLTMAIVNICRFRGAGLPVYSAANALALMTALVSMFFLQGCDVPGLRRRLEHGAGHELDLRRRPRGHGRGRLGVSGSDSGIRDKGTKRPRTRCEPRPGQIISAFSPADT